jgi:hypothetical protein
MGVSLERLYEVNTHTFPWIRYPWNTRVIADLFRVSLKYPTVLELVSAAFFLMWFSEVLLQ